MSIYQRDRTARVFAANLKHYLQASNLSQVRFAAKLGISPQTLQMQLDGSVIPRWATLQKITDSLGISVNELLTAKDDILMPFQWLQFNVQEIFSAPNQYTKYDLFNQTGLLLAALDKQLTSDAPLAYSTVQRLSDYVDLPVAQAESELPASLRRQYHLKNYYVHLIQFDQTRNHSISS